MLSSILSSLPSLINSVRGRRIYFIYTEDRRERFSDRLTAGSELSYFSYSALAYRFPSVQFLKHQNENPLRLALIGPQDIVIGHIGETFQKVSQKTRRLIAFYPWTGHIDATMGDMRSSLKEERDFLELSSSIILLTSSFDLRQYIEKPTNLWHEFIQNIQKKKRLTIVSQPIDTTFFRRVKWDYSTSNFLYIGNLQTRSYEEANALVCAHQSVLHQYCTSQKKHDSRNWVEVSNHQNLADFFIQPGLWQDPEVSILEPAARGFIPVVTPETGYPYEHPFMLRRDDSKYNESVLKDLLHTTPKERRILADYLYNRLLSDKNVSSWQKLASVLSDEVVRLMS